MSRATVSHTLAVARAELGTKESPAGSNHVKYTEWYRLIGPWCAMFISWVADKAGATDIIPRHAWTPAGAQWFKDRSQWGSRPRVGAIVYYDFGSRISHVGIVETVHGDGSWTAIEGNTDERGGRTGGKVMRRRRYGVGRTGGFGYPDYAPEPKPSRSSGRTSRRDTARVKAWQALLEFAPSGIDGDWGALTEGRSQRMRSVAAHHSTKGFPVSTVELLQRIVDTSDDGVWGPRSEEGLAEWVKDAQRLLGVKADGDWGPKTDAAYLAFRKANYNKF
jgi:surface antigen